MTLKIAVIGGGIGGLSAALALLKEGFDVHVYEQAPRFGEIGAGGQLFVCSPCFKKRGLDETQLIDGAQIVGGAKLVEFLAQDAASISF